MSDSLIEELPKIIKRGRKEANKILDSLSNNSRLTLQTDELVLSSKDEIEYSVNSIKEALKDQIVNKLIHGDNLLIMQVLLAGDKTTPSMRGKIDLIYIDPPFDSKKDYMAKVKLKDVTIEQFAYSDTWKKGTISYLEMMVPRLILMKELLSENGTIYVHIDWRVGHYIKIIMDEIFGRDNLMNEIVWCYKSGGASAAKGFAKKHDVIYAYNKSNNFIFNNIKEKSYMGIGYTTGNKNVTLYDDNDGKGPYTLVNVKDWWTDIGMIATSKGRLYPTQKPKELLERIISVSSNEDSIVADFFGGSGTMCSVAEDLGRKWITSDLSKTACMVTRKRLVEQKANPFLYQSIGDYQKEQLIQTCNLRFSSLTVKKPTIENYNEELETLTVELDNYVLLSPEALPLDEKNKKKLSEIIDNDPLSLIEYWSIDPDYDEKVFRSKWQNYRKNTTNNNDSYKVTKCARINVPKLNRNRVICVKAVDVFGFENATTIKIK